MAIITTNDRLMIYANDFIYEDPSSTGQVVKIKSIKKNEKLKTRIADAIAISPSGNNHCPKIKH